MKVCTDACLFAAWVAQGPQLAARSIMDIGAGTGLLSLMYAQKKPAAIIDAVEIDEAASKQAKENFDASPWNDRLNTYNLSIQQFTSTTTKRYDVIFSNPPFYENELETEDQKRNVALHSSALSFEDLLSAVDQLLANDGSFFVLLPYHRTKVFEELAAKKNLFVKEKILVKQTSEHNYFRCMLCLTRKPAAAINQTDITIMGSDNKYTRAFVQLLKDYYLYL
ncbi:MAG TPA: methyltransferase [Parafilimonas sp.]|nr:methyltransferase [Parafilimonas sp.]